MDPFDILLHFPGFHRHALLQRRKRLSEAVPRAVKVAASLPADPGCASTSSSDGQATITTKVDHAVLECWFAQVPRHLMVEILCCADFLTRMKILKVCKYWKHLLDLPEISSTIHSDVPRFITLAEQLKFNYKYYRLYPSFQQMTLAIRPHQHFSDISPAHFTHFLLKCYKVDTLNLTRLPMDEKFQWPLDPSDRRPFRIRILETTCQLTIAGPIRSGKLRSTGPLYVDVTWTVDLTCVEFFKLEQVTAAIDALWWPYPESQKDWLKTYAKILKNDHFWRDWIVGNFSSDVGYMDLLLAEATYEDLDVIVGAQTGRILCSMAAFIIRRGIPNMKRPPHRFAFETAEFSSFAYRSTPFR